MHISDDEIHIWTSSLALPVEREQAFGLLLSPDEQARAARFRFPEHKRRFIVARAVLRQILSFYTEIAPNKLEFSYGEHGKPTLATPSTLQFNLTHSEDLAAYAIGHQLLGIDIEKIKSNYEIGLPERFFSLQEREHLLQVPEAGRVAAFYQVWARKEAIIKASGKGLATSLASYSVSPNNIEEKIQLGYEEWYLQPLSIDSAFAAALASKQAAKKLSYYNFTDYLIKL
jgi:4'-phosphopantetheinyl transferase